MCNFEQATATFVASSKKKIKTRLVLCVLTNVTRRKWEMLRETGTGIWDSKKRGGKLRVMLHKGF